MTLSLLSFDRTPMTNDVATWPLVVDIVVDGQTGLCDVGGRRIKQLSRRFDY